MSDITVDTIREVLTRATLSKSSKRSLYAALRALFDSAVLSEVITRNPVLLMPRPKIDSRKSRAVGSEMIAELVKVSRADRLGASVLFLVTSGTRRGEMLAVRWSDLDLEKGQVEISGSLSRSSAGLVRGPTKSKAGIRTVPLPPVTVAALKLHARAQKEERMASRWWDDSGFVFVTKRGGPIEPRTYSRWFAGMAIKAGLPETGVHITRHSAATIWLQTAMESGASIKDLADLLGHSNPELLLSLYASAIPESQRAATDALAAKIAGLW